jgi:23S rRNA pseudouridine1911/1915/1917 synthase
MTNMKFIVNEPARVMDLLVQKLKLASLTKARNLVKDGSVQVDGQTVDRAELLVRAGQTIQIKKVERQRPPRKAPFEILFNDESVIVVVKPAGVLSVNRDNEVSITLLKQVGTYIEQRAFIVHRLDREVSGIMIFAKSHEIQKQLESRWTENEKRYLALVEGVPSKDSGTLESWLAENAAFKVYSTPHRELAKQAITHYKVVRKWPRNALVEIQLETGRKHQIRVHLSDMGCPIVGDKKYGAKTDPFKRIALHAFRFSFHHPVTGEYLSFESPFPLTLKF